MRLKSIQDRLKLAAYGSEVNSLVCEAENAKFMSGKTRRRIERLAAQKLRDIKAKANAKVKH